MLLAALCKARPLPVQTAHTLPACPPLPTHMISTSQEGELS